MRQAAHSCNVSNLFKPPQVGTNLTDLTLKKKKKKKVTLRELGGCMGPIWPSYFNDCSSVIVCSYRVYCMHLQHLTLTVGIFWLFLCVFTQFMVDSVNIAQISSSCVQLLSVLSAEPLRSVSVLILLNKRWHINHINPIHCIHLAFLQESLSARSIQYIAIIIILFFFHSFSGTYLALWAS